MAGPFPAPGLCGLSSSELAWGPGSGPLPGRPGPSMGDPLALTPVP